MKKNLKTGVVFLMATILLCVLIPANVIADSGIGDVTADWSSKSVRRNENGYVDLTYTNVYEEQIRITLVGVHFDWLDDSVYYRVDYSSDPVYIATGGSETTRLNFEVDEGVELGSHSYNFLIKYEVEGFLGWSEETWLSETSYDFTVLEKDRDGDGVGDSEDAFPDNPDESKDTDEDGIGDNQDAFPSDPLEHTDTDDDGVGDNSDEFPEDPDETKDSDSDGIGDNSDKFPNDVSASKDSDDDGYPDEWNTGKTEKDSTSGLKLDAYPNDPEKFEKKTDDSPGFELIIVLIAIFIVLAIVAIKRE